MNKKDTYILLMVFLSWVSIPFLGVKTIKRFLPATLLMLIYLSVESVIAERKKWWWFHYNVKPNALGAIPLLIGPFFVGSLWILKYTFGQFKLYLITNFFVNSIFTYILLDWFKMIRYMSLVRLTKLKMSLTFLIESNLLYGFQLLVEKYTKRNKQMSS